MRSTTAHWRTTSSSGLSVLYEPGLITPGGAGTCTAADASMKIVRRSIAQASCLSVALSSAKVYQPTAAWCHEAVVARLARSSLGRS